MGGKCSSPQLSLDIVTLSSVLLTSFPPFFQAECAPESYRRLLRYCTGLLLSLSWCTYLASCAVVMSHRSKYCILLYHPTATSISSRWFPTLMAIGLLVFSAIVNIYLAKRFPLLEDIGLFVHLASWAGIVVTLWMTSPPGRTSEVFFISTDGGGWGRVVLQP